MSNGFTIYGRYTVISLTQGKFACIDTEDLARVQQFSWMALKSRKTWYAKVTVAYASIYMHNLVLGRVPRLEDPNLETDHINGLGTDNRKENLRVVTRSENKRRWKFE